MTRNQAFAIPDAEEGVGAKINWAIMLPWTASNAMLCPPTTIAGGWATFVVRKTRVFPKLHFVGGVGGGLEKTVLGCASRVLSLGRTLSLSHQYDSSRIEKGQSTLSVSSL